MSPRQNAVMAMRRFVPIALTLLVAAVLYFGSRRHPDARAARGGVGVLANDAATQRVSVPARTPPAAAAISPVEFPYAARLNAPGSTIAGDLDALRQILETWRSNFPHEGNPVGENNEITAALTGDNPLHLVLIPKSHPALDAHGELCDRWGTPFRFHQLSGTRMEIRSAGPDRKFRTEDDAVWSPE